MFTNTHNSVTMERRSEPVNFYFHLGLSYNDILVALVMRDGIILSRRTLLLILKDNRLRQCIKLTSDRPGGCEGGVSEGPFCLLYENLPIPFYTQKLALYTHLLSGGSDFTTFSVSTKGFEELQTYLTA